MSYFKRWNLIVGWLVFAIAALVYILTMEPTASLWDCAEFIATSYKLEVGHPPGAPLFMMIARFFTMFAPSPEKVAWMVNLMSSLCGGFTILFLFWSITHLARRVYSRNGKKLSTGKVWTVIGAGAVGALAYAFTDTQWFSAVEAEVYSMSSMFTALVFWAMLKWEEVADKPHANRWLVLIAFLMGLSTGVHILNLLTIPALVFIYYFKNTPKATWGGVVKATLVAGAILVSINYIIIPVTVQIGAFVDRIAVNSLGLPINLGFAIFALLLFALCAWAIFYTHKKGMVVLNTIILCTTVILLGYSSYASVVIRATANPPMNSNNPDNPYGLYSMIKREQYGSRPLLYGPHYSSPAIANKESKIYYVGDDGKYKQTTKLTGVEYPDEFMFFLPRMWDYSKVHDYEAWVDVEGRYIPFHNEMIKVPTFGENLKFMMSYQVNFMYWRYFLWNFVGRQSDIQSHGEVTNGNWLSGIKAIDQLYLGPQDNLPSEMADNKARNKYYFLPFILGLVGLIYQLNRDKRNFTVVMWLFLMMGLVLVLYFNSSPVEPRERDYVYVGSFYAFCIWIGMGVLALRDAMAKLIKRDSVVIAVAATALGAIVPTILIAQNWDDHNRSHRYVARDIGWNYLQAALPNSIILSYGDNDTFPIWYNQEVEGVRLDVKMMNTSYLGGEWYVDQMRDKSNEADPVPFSLPRSKYYAKNEVMPIIDMVGGKTVSVRTAIDFVNSEDSQSKYKLYDGSMVDFLPAKNLAIPVNKENAIKSGIVKEEDADLMVDTIYIRLEGEMLARNNLMVLDMLATFDWERPICFTQLYDMVSPDLRNYLQFDGYAYRLVPIRTEVKNQLEIGRIDTEYLYNNLMNLFRYGNVSDERVYVDYFSQHNFNSTRSRGAYARLAKQLLMEGDTTGAVEVLDRGVELMPFNQVRHSYILTYPIIEGYYLAGAYDKGNEILEDYATILKEYVLYFQQFKGRHSSMVVEDIREKMLLLSILHELAEDFGQFEQTDDIEAFFDSIDKGRQLSPQIELTPEMLEALESQDLQTEEGGV